MRIVALLLISSLSVHALAAEYYLSPAGDDGNPGSRDRPWRTVARANATLTAGDTVYLRDGTYWRDAIRPAHSGDAGRPITYRAFPGEQPVIDMGTPFRQRWTRISGTDGVDAIYEAPFPYSRGDFYAIAEGTTETSGRYTVWWRKDGCCTSRMGPNTVDAIEGPGQFYFSGEKIRARGAHSDDLNDRTLVGLGATKDAAIVLDQSHVVVDGITFRNMGSFAIRGDTTPISHFTLQNCVVRNLAFTAYLSHIENVVWRGNTFDGLGTYMRDAGEVGFTTGSRNVLIENNTFAWGGHNALYLGNRSSIGAGDDAHFVVRGNKFRDGGRQLLIRKVQDILIEDNEFMFSAPRHESMTRLGKDNQAVKIYGSRAIVRNNRIWAHGGGGIYLLAIGKDGVETIHTNDNRVYHNTVIDGRGRDWGGIVLHKGMDQERAELRRNVVINNIVWNNAVSDLQFIGDAAAEPGNVVRDNLSGKDPRFVDYRAGDGWPSRSVVADRSPDLRLRHDSPAVDAAVPLTRTRSAGSGRDLAVQDSRFFTDGFGVVDGDRIVIGANAPVRVVGVDHANGTLRLAEAMTWQKGAGVSLAHVGAAPDLGALEYVETSLLAPSPPMLW